MAKFKKLPVVIDAVQLTWQNWNEICDFVTKPAFAGGVWLDDEGRPTRPTEGFPEPGSTPRFGNGNDDIGLLINTLEGQMLGRGNDWIIKGVNGEFYPCKPDIFEKTYVAA
jgi:hypothetical protein